ncbi:RNA-binding S4 domain-containing protein [Thermosediminibacter oceani]|uniref:RNA-binding S4 domain protein n=1 Tax=Thermosediminibacter oceani (strain ATCC BAA-1034 / DSM 16646 / JW/IW-1228P) TaxID=555079 RepID=D9RYX2_THEOJ|nr:RNA-binding S4 domain-containing protein [Thermosediminibacter oceani]ADL06800.1 RNA-binding S4 domain protein [Thermosediminibacter oceani DSM 16646]
MREVFIKTESINLDQFLKWAGAVFTGGEAKIKIRQGLVKVNGQVETRRSRKLFPGDTVEFHGETFVVKGGSE